MIETRTELGQLLQVHVAYMYGPYVLTETIKTTLKRYHGTIVPLTAQKDPIVMHKSSCWRLSILLVVLVTLSHAHQGHKAPYATDLRSEHAERPLGEN